MRKILKDILVHKLNSFPGEIWNDPHTRKTRRDRRKRWTTSGWQVAGLVTKATYLRGLSQAAARLSRSPHQSTRTLKVYIEALIGFGHIYHPDDLNTTLLSQGYILETAPSVGMMGRTYIPRTEEVWGWGTFDCLGPALRSTCSHILSTTSSNSGPLKLIERVEEDLIWRIFTKVLGMGDMEESQGMLPWLRISHHRAVTTPKLKGTRKDGMARESHTENWPDSSSDLCLKRLHIEGPTDKHPEPTLLPPSHL